MKYQIITEIGKKEWAQAIKELNIEDTYFIEWDDTAEKSDILRIIIKDPDGPIFLLYQASLDKFKLGFLNLVNVRCGT